MHKKLYDALRKMYNDISSEELKKLEIWFPKEAELIANVQKQFGVFVPEDANIIAWSEQDRDTFSDNPNEDEGDK